MSRLQDLAARLSARLASLPIEQLASARDTLHQAADRVNAADGNPHSDILQSARQRLLDAAERADQAAAKLRSCTEHLTAYLANPVGISAPDITTAPLRRSRGTGTGWAFSKPAPFYRRFLDQLPARLEPRSPTEGVLTTPDGRRLEAVRSGKSGPGATGPGLREPVKRYLAATDHAEGQAAALLRTVLRDKGITEATLYLNNRPCTFRRGCDRTLPAQLPEGTTLTVYWPGGVKVYRGTGEGIA